MFFIRRFFYANHVINDDNIKFNEILCVNHEIYCFVDEKQKVTIFHNYLIEIAIIFAYKFSSKFNTKNIELFANYLKKTINFFCKLSSIYFRKIRNFFDKLYNDSKKKIFPYPLRNRVYYISKSNLRFFSKTQKKIKILKKKIQLKN